MLLGLLGMSVKNVLISLTVCFFCIFVFACVPQQFHTVTPLSKRPVYKYITNPVGISFKDVSDII